MPLGNAHSSPGFGSVPPLLNGKPGIFSPVCRLICFKSMSAAWSRAQCWGRLKSRAPKKSCTGSSRPNLRACCVKMCASLRPLRGLFSSGAGSRGISAWSRDGSSTTPRLTASICSSVLLRVQSLSGWKCVEAASSWKSWSRTCSLVRGEAGMPRPIAGSPRIIRATSSRSRISRPISGRSRLKSISACGCIPPANRFSSSRSARCRRVVTWKWRKPNALTEQGGYSAADLTTALHAEFPAISVRIVEPDAHVRRAGRFWPDLIAGILEVDLVLSQMRQRFSQRSHVRQMK